jgi:hypothetical protein
MTDEDFAAGESAEDFTGDDDDAGAETAQADTREPARFRGQYGFVPATN